MGLAFDRKHNLQQKFNNVKVTKQSLYKLLTQFCPLVQGKWEQSSPKEHAKQMVFQLSLDLKEKYLKVTRNVMSFLYLVDSLT